jgi:hypothetical protein
MRRVLLLLICVICFSPVLYAQKTQNEIACFAEWKDNSAHKKKLWNGYEISLGQVPNPEEVEFRCTAAIYNSAGRVVFRTSGFNVVFDEDLTGEDFDGDGEPEVVFKTDTGGGNHCCWGYIIFSLSPKPHKLFEIVMEGRVDFEKDKDGKMLIWKRTAGPGEFTSMAERPFAEKVLRVRDGKLVDATPEFCARIWSDTNEDHRIEKEILTPENLNKFQKGEGPETENGPIVSALLSRALQHVFCRQFDEALKDLNLWPEASRADMKASFGASVREEYPEFVEKLREPAKRN